MTTQVIPELTRLVSQGDGTHRVTLRLQPAALGDVRVVLTVRGGDVRVSLAAGSEARTALLADAPALHRMLTGSGAESIRIVVRDPVGGPGTLAPTATSSTAGAPTSSAPAAPSATPSVPPTDGSGGSTGSGASSAADAGAFGPGHHSSPGHGGSGEGQAWTPGHTPATDGRSNSGSLPASHRTIDQDAVAPLSGVDVTM